MFASARALWSSACGSVRLRTWNIIFKREGDGELLRLAKKKPSQFGIPKGRQKRTLQTLSLTEQGRGTVHLLRPSESGSLNKGFSSRSQEAGKPFKSCHAHALFSCLQQESIIYMPQTRRCSAISHCHQPRRPAAALRIRMETLWSLLYLRLTVAWAQKVD